MIYTPKEFAGTQSLGMLPRHEVNTWLGTLSPEKGRTAVAYGSAKDGMMCVEIYVPDGPGKWREDDHMFLRAGNLETIVRAFSSQFGFVHKDDAEDPDKGTQESMSEQRLDLD